MLRNPLYGYAKLTGIKFKDSYTLVTSGDLDISDKYKIPGKQSSKLYDGNKIVGFEYYFVLPYSETKDFRARLGWKISSTDKFKQYGFAQFVDTVNPFDGYGS